MNPATRKLPKMQNSFAARLLAWFERHGRRQLPWQENRSVYKVWVSEIMLQQTRVATVIPYFERFMRKYPDVFRLAAAPQDELLALWAGLGYYARARNLHKTAQVVVGLHGGDFPDTLDGLMELPGVGRSTAGAILSIGFGRSAPILDGNVRRVLARHRGVEGWPGERKTTEELWQLAGQLTPRNRAGEYNQALMDLGATLCRRSRPECNPCPLKADCVARRDGRQEQLPARRPARKKPVRSTVFLMLEDGRGKVLLRRRPPAGVWGGLWSFPETTGPAADLAGFGVTEDMVALRTEWPTVRHTFTHFHLDISPRLVRLRQAPALVREAGEVWVHPKDAEAYGSPAPVARLLERLAASR